MTQYKDYNKIVLVYRHQKYSLMYTWVDDSIFNRTVLIYNEKMQGGYVDASCIQMYFDTIEEAQSKCSEYLV